jgi:hypothetical protein
MTTHTVRIDLGSIESKSALIALLGETFNFGGTDGNRPVDAVNSGSGWGMNWDAVADSFCYLESGGIWGTSPKFAFPLRLEFESAGACEERLPEAFAVLKEILYETRAKYRADGLVLEFDFT